jgi:hypothetical protein
MNSTSRKTHPMAQITDAARDVNRLGKLGTVIVRT